jgi:hypothetical protein
MGASDLAHPAFADAGGLGHHHRRPMGHLMQRVALGQCYHALGQLGPQGKDPQGRRLVTQKTVDAVGYEALLPAPGASLLFAGSAHARVRAEPGGAEKNDGRAPHAFLGGVAVTDNHHQAVTVLGGQADVSSCAYPTNSQVHETSGISCRPLNVKFCPLAPQVWASLNTRS